MTETSCQNPEEHCDFHACQLTATIRNPEIDKIFENPRFACTNCGAKVHNAANVCQPKPL
jgi:hypothetical protein